MSADVALEVDGLTVVAGAGPDAKRILNGVSLTVNRGEVMAIVGESGSGKSTLCYALVGLLAENLDVSEGSAHLGGVDLVQMSPRERRDVRGSRIGFVFQDPLSALNPVRRIMPQLTEGRTLHKRDRSKRASKEWAINKLEELGFTDPQRVAKSFPHELSGGMRQRVCIGIAVSGEPEIIVADEPTTALDVSLQGKLLDLLLAEAELTDSALIFVSHDLAVVRSIADKICIMYGGRVMETGPAESVLENPTHPYTRALLASHPKLDPETRGTALPTIQGENVGNTPSRGCPFSARCPRATVRCVEEFPEESVSASGQSYWCWNPEVA